MKDDDDELTITWPTITDTSFAYDVNTMSTTAITNGGTGGTFTYGSADFMNQPSTVWTTNTTAGSNYQFRDWNLGNSNVVPSGQLNLVGNNADVVINGKSLTDTLTAIQESLGMLVPNPDMEAEWDQLRELGERYRELEKLCKEKSTAWNKLKKI